MPIALDTSRNPGTSSSLLRATGQRHAVTIRSLACIAAVWAATSLAGLGSISLAEPDEPRFAEATRQMFTRGDFLTPYFNGVPRFEKPILFYWMQAISSTLVGDVEAAARMPAALAGLGCLLLTWAMGRRLFSERTGLVGAVILATTFRFLVWTRQGLTDVPVMFFMSAALYLWLRAFEGGSRQRILALAGWAAIGLAALTKGPVAVLPVLIVIAYVIVSRQWTLVSRWHAAAGLLLAAFIVLPWYVWMTWLHGRAFLDFALGYEVLARYGYPGASFPSANRSFLWYAAVYPGDAAPWTLFLAAGAGFGAWRAVHGVPGERRAVIFLATWFITIFAVFASAQFKVTHYILPAYPAASILAAYLIDRAIAGETQVPRLLWSVPFALTSIALAATAAILAWFLHRVFFTPWLDVGMAAPAALGAGVVAATASALRGNRAGAIGGIVAGVALATACVATIVAPRELQRYQPIQALGERVAELAAPDEHVGLYGRLGGPGLIYYSRHDITWLDAPEQASSFMSATERRFLVIPQADFNALALRHSGPLYVLDRGTFFNVRFKRLFEQRASTDERPMLLVSNRPAPSSNPSR